MSVKMTEIADALLATYPWFMETDVIAIQQYCRNEAAARMYDAWIWGELDKGRSIETIPYSLQQSWRAAEVAAMRSADRIGLSPEGRMKIAKDAGFAQHFNTERIGTLTDQGRALRAAGGK